MIQIQFILERFFYGWNMNVFAFDKENHITEFFMGTKEKVSRYDDRGLDMDIFFVEGNVWFEEMRQKTAQKEIPVIHMDEDGIYYLAFADKEENLYLFGPASVEKLSFAQQIAYRKRHHVKNQNYMVPRVSLACSLNGVALVYYMLTGVQVTEQEIMQASELQQTQEPASDIAKYQIRNEAEQKPHLAYQDELKWVAQIENGTLDIKENRMTPENLAKLEQIGTLASENSLKQFEYMAVTSTILASRAAIRGGANTYEVYQMSEVFLQKIAKCKNVMEMLQIHSQVAGEFANQVRLAKENRSHDCVEQCKDYIARHRTKKFSLEDVAEAVGKNPSYLSRVFSEQTGMTMQEYALNVRLEAAANLLRHSNEGIGEIAEYLSFPSQSYFGERFKKKYGITPAAYRKQHKIRDFKE